MKRTLIFLALILCATIPALAQQSGYGGDGKAASGASVSSFIRLYETAPGAATTALAGAGAGNVDNGAHLVKVTCYTPGGETTGGTASNSTTVADKTTNGKIALTGIPTCSSIATGRKVYMTAAGGSSYFLLSNGTIANNTATTLTVNDADATLTASTALPTSNTALDTRLTVGQNSSTFAVQALFSSGSVALPGIAFSAATTTGFFKAGTGIGVSVGAGEGTWFSGAIIYQPYGGGYAFSSSNSTSSGSTYFKIAMDGTGDTAVLTGNVAGGGFLQNTGGEGSLTAAFTNATTTMAASNLSYAVRAGRSYRIHGILAIANSTAGHGVQLDFNGGNATATTFWAAAAVVSGSVVAGTTVSTSLAGVINFTTVTGTTYVVIDGYIKVNAAGTLILRAAEDNTGGASASIAAGSWIALSDTVLK